MRIHAATLFVLVGLIESVSASGEAGRVSSPSLQNHTAEEVRELREEVNSPEFDLFVKERYELDEAVISSIECTITVVNVDRGDHQDPSLIYRLWIDGDNSDVLDELSKYIYLRLCRHSPAYARKMAIEPAMESDIAEKALITELYDHVNPEHLVFVEKRDSIDIFQLKDDGHIWEYSIQRDDLGKAVFAVQRFRGRGEHKAH